MDRNLFSPGICSDHQFESILKKSVEIIYKLYRKQYTKISTHLYDQLDVLNLVHELHLCDPPDVLELPDRPDHRQQKQKRQEQKQQHSLQQQRGARA